ncbi:MAG: ATP-binding protein, partial [Alphaproteobacteria bacterium]
IAIRAGRRADSVVLTVDDDGPGIPPDKREDVFRPFYRLDTSRNRETGGVGLGLAISRDIIRGHGGEIVLDNSPLGGLRAQIRLPF